MGAIKDLVDLVTQLSNSIEDRKFAAELRDIQSMIGKIQSEQAELHEQRIELMTENAELKRELADLKMQSFSLGNQEEPIEKNIGEEGEKILLYLTNRDEVTSVLLAQEMGLSKVRAEYWLELMEEKRFVHASYAMNMPIEYSLKQEGRRFLIEKGLI